MSVVDYTPLGAVTNAAVDSIPTGQVPPVSVDDINAITTYISDAKPVAIDNPVASKIIADYALWISNISWYRMHFDTGNVFREAKFYRDKLNTALKREATAGSVPADSLFSTLYPSATVDPTPKPPLIPTKYKYGFAIGAGAIAAIALLKKLRVL
jgi:hypothetical protein